MSGSWGGARAGAGRKSYAELNHIRELLKQGVSDQDWIDMSKELVILAKAWRSDDGKVKPRESIQAIKTLYRYQQALVPTAEEEKQAEEPEPIKLIEVHRSCERDCPVHPEYHPHAPDEPSDPAPPSTDATSSSTNACTNPSIQNRQSKIENWESSAELSDAAPSSGDLAQGHSSFIPHPSSFLPPPGPDLLGPSAPGPAPERPAPVETPRTDLPPPVPGQGSRKRVMALLEQERQRRLASVPEGASSSITPALQRTHVSPRSRRPPERSEGGRAERECGASVLHPSSLTSRAPVPPTPGVPPKPEDFIPLPQEFYRFIGRIPLSKWGLPAGCYIMPDGGKLIHGAGARPKPPAPKPPGPGS